MPLLRAIRHPLGDSVPEPWRPEYAEYGVCINSGPYDGLPYQEAVNAIAEASPAATMVETGSGEIEVANEAFCRLLGIESAPQSGADGLDRLAAVAYRAGRFDLAERLVAAVAVTS